MTESDWITIVGTVVTIGATVVTIVATIATIDQAKKARRASTNANTAVAKVRLAANADRLRSAQEHIRSLPSTQAALRGTNTARLIAGIRQEFDNTLSALPKDGPGSTARKLLETAQASLNKYEHALATEVDREAWQVLQTQVQDAISDLTAAAALPGETK
jgi:hypothetical protein